MKTTVEKALRMFGLLKLLGDPHTAVVEGKTVKLPPQFTGGGTYNIAKNINIVRRAVDDFNTAKALIKDLPADEFEKRVDEILKEETELTGLLKLKVASLNLDVNPIDPKLVADLMHYGLLD